MGSELWSITCITACYITCMLYFVLYTYITCIMVCIMYMVVSLWFSASHSFPTGLISEGSESSLFSVHSVKLQHQKKKKKCVWGRRNKLYHWKSMFIRRTYEAWICKAKMMTSQYLTQNLILLLVRVGCGDCNSHGSDAEKVCQDCYSLTFMWQCTFISLSYSYAWSGVYTT